MRYALGKAQHHAEYPLRYRPIEDAARVGQHDIAIDQLREHGRIDAGAGPVNPAQPVGRTPGLPQVVGAEIPAQQRVRARQRRAQLVGAGGKANFRLSGKFRETRNLVYPARALHQQYRFHTHLHW